MGNGAGSRELRSAIGLVQGYEKMEKVRKVAPNKQECQEFLPVGLGSCGGLD